MTAPDTRSPEPTTPAEPDQPTAEERETALALDALCRTIEEADAAIAARQAKAA